MRATQKGQKVESPLWNFAMLVNVASNVLLPARAAAVGNRHPSHCVIDYPPPTP